MCRVQDQNLTCAQKCKKNVRWRFFFSFKKPFYNFKNKKFQCLNLKKLLIRVVWELPLKINYCEMSKNWHFETWVKLFSTNFWNYPQIYWNFFFWKEGIKMSFIKTWTWWFLKKKKLVFFFQWHLSCTNYILQGKSNGKIC
jgi:hypothetical protein